MGEVRSGRNRHFAGGLTQSASRPVVDHHFDRMVPAVVDKGNRLVLSFHSVDGHDRPAFPPGLLPDVDFIGRLAIPVVHLEPFPFRGEARSRTQLVHFQRQTQEGFHDQSAPDKVSAEAHPLALSTIRFEGYGAKEDIPHDGPFLYGDQGGR